MATDLNTDKANEGVDKSAAKDAAENDALKDTLAKVAQLEAEVKSLTEALSGSVTVADAKDLAKRAVSFTQLATALGQEVTLDALFEDPDAEANRVVTAVGGVERNFTMDHAMVYLEARKESLATAAADDGTAALDGADKAPAKPANKVTEKIADRRAEARKKLFG